MSGSDGVPPDLRRHVANWVAYLGEIGVRELNAPAVGAPAPVQAGGGSLRRKPAPASVPAPVPAEEKPVAASPAAVARLEAIRSDLGDCTRCKLHQGRTKLVFGVGNPEAKLMFVGEGPGAEEDARGEPFVGRAGRKLDQMIEAIGLKRAEVYIANVVKCRPPKNRDPEADEIATCSPFLAAQIAAIRPRVIVTLGSPATKTLLQTKVGITRLRGTWQEFEGIPVMPTYHPAYLLRAYTRENRTKVFDDLKAARARLDDS